jgi:GGDEF domain-containing protein
MHGKSGWMERGVPRRRRPGPVVIEGVEALLLRSQELAKGWLLALVEDVPLEAAAAIMVGDVARDGPRICDAVVRAVYDEEDLRRIEAGGVLEPLVSRAGELAGVGSAEADAHAVETLRSVIWSALRVELVRSDPEALADAGERLSLVAELVRAAVLRRRAEREAAGDPRRRVSPLRVAQTDIPVPRSLERRRDRPASGPYERRASDPPERRASESPERSAPESAERSAPESAERSAPESAERSASESAERSASEPPERPASESPEHPAPDFSERRGEGSAAPGLEVTGGTAAGSDATGVGGVERGGATEGADQGADGPDDGATGWTTDEAPAPSWARGPLVGDPLWIGALRDEIVRAARVRSPLSLLLVELDEAERMIAVEPGREASATFGRFAQAVRTALRHRDVLACETESRAWIIARDTGRAGAQALGSRIVTAVPAEESWRGAPLTVSVGLAVLGEDGHNAAALIDVAEQMRFAAEASGIGIVTGEPGEENGEPPGSGPGLAG